MTRRLPAVISPEPGESLPSWVDRQSAEYDVPRGLLAEALGLPLRQVNAEARVVFYGVAATDQTIATMQAATGMSAEVIAGMHLSRYAGTVLDLQDLDLAWESSIITMTGREWANFHGSRACPVCLRAAPVWPLWWRLGVAAVCPKHAVLLADECPQCGIGLRRGYRSRPRGLSRARVLDPRECSNHVTKGLCPQLVEQLAAPPVPEQTVEAQQMILDIASGARTRWAGQLVPQKFWTTAVPYLAALVRFAVTPGELAAQVPFAAAQVAFADEREDRLAAPAGVGARLTGPPPSAAGTAAILTMIGDVLAAQSTQTAQDALRPLVEGRFRQRRLLPDRHDPLRNVPCPPLLAETMSRAAPPIFRVARNAVRKQSQLEFRHIPPLIGELDYDEVVAVHLPHANRTMGRRFAAMAVARLVGAGCWPDADAALGATDRRRSAMRADRTGRRVSDPAAFWSAIEEIVRRLSAAEHIDYAARRAALATVVEAPHPVVARTGSGPVTVARRRHAAAWTWQHFTGSDVWQAPAYTGQGLLGESVRDGYRRFLCWSAAGRPVMEDWGQQLLAARGVR